MGILIMNICSFAGPSWYYFVPLTTAKPVFSGPHMHLNTFFWFARMILAEGKMRALFSMLFGAGVILLTERAEARGAGLRTADIFTRRSMWLALFGILHCFLIWNGDILFFYGTYSLLFLFPCRRLRAKTLLIAGGTLLLISTLSYSIPRSISMNHARVSAAEARAAEAAHRPLTDKQKEGVADWNKLQQKFRPTSKELYKEIAGHQQGYVKAQIADAKNAFEGETIGEYLGFPDVLGMMFIGMGLYRLGFLSGKLRARTYGLTALIALGVTWPVLALACWKSFHNHFDLVQTNNWLNYTYDLGRIGGALGNAALLLLFLRLGRLRWPLARIANVGQMAFSNYILTSLTMKLIFTWGFWHWYGYVEYYKLYIAVALMWLTNLVFSTLWLRQFSFGPLEWCWRSLTYWKRQPMRLHAESARSTVHEVAQAA